MPTPVPIGDLLVRLRGESTQFTAMMVQAQATVAATSKSIAASMAAAQRAILATSATMSRMGRRMSTMFTAPILVASGLSVKAFADFDNAMTKSLAIMGDISMEMRKEMEATARTLARQSTFSAEQAAESYFFLASAGLSAEASVAALPTVMRFAQAGAFDMAQATDLLTDAQSALGLTIRDDVIKNMENMAQLSDVLVKANTLANATVEQFSIALTSQAGAALKSFNIDAEEGVAVLAAFADQGVKAELAGNALSRILRLVTSAAVKNKEAYEELNVKVFDSEGQIRNMADIIEDLENALGGMSDEQRVASLEMLGFQARVQGVVMPLLGTSSAIREYERQLRGAAGTTQEVAEKQLKSFSAQMRLLWNNIVDVAIEVGQSLVPSLIWMKDQISRLLDFWRGLSDETKRFIGIVAAVAAIAGPALLAMSAIVGIIGSAVGAIAGAVTFVGGAFSAMAGIVLGTVSPIIPILLLVAGVTAAIGAAIAGVVVWLVGPEGLSDAWNTAKDGALQFAKGALGFLVNFRENMGIIVEWLRENWQILFSDLGRMVVVFLQNMAHNLAVAVNTGIELFGAWAAWLSRKFDETFGQNFVTALVGGLVLGAKKVFEWSQSVAQMILAALTGKEISTEIGTLTASLQQGIRRGASSDDILETSKQILQERFGEMKGALEGFEFRVESPELNLNVGDLETAAKTVQQTKKQIGDASDLVKQALQDVPQEIQEVVVPELPEAVAAPVPAFGAIPQAEERRNRQQFETIALRRFNVEGLRAPGEKQDVKAKGVEDRLDQLIELTRNKPGLATLG